jgi:Bacterial Ig-like domain (group 3)/IPT/TIG domain/Carboxypeptidase regulatory-like domain
VSRRSLLRVLLVCAVVALGLIAVPVSSAAAATLSGQVTGQIPGGKAEPVAGATISVTGVEGEEVVASSTTGGEGFYSLEVPSGVFDVHVAPNEGSGFQATTIHKVEVGETRHLDISLSPAEAVTLSGTLRDAAGEPIPWVTMVLVGEHNVVTNAGPEGAFSLSATPGEYHLSVYGTGGPDLPHHWMVFSETFDLTADRSGDVVLPPTRTLTVQALGSGGTPLEGATVVFPTYDGAEISLGEFAGESESETDTAVTDAEGRASVHVFADSKPETGGYDGRALVEPAPGSGYGVTQFEAPAVGGEAETVVVHPTPAVTLSGTLRDAAGEPLPNVSVVLVGEHNVGTTTGPGGAYTLSAVPGEYHLSVYGTGGPELPHHWMAFADTFELTADRESDLVLPPTRKLTVEALGSGGAPLEGATVVFPSYDGSQMALGGFPAGEADSETDTAVTDAEGRASVYVFAGSKPETGGYDGRAFVEPAAGSGYGVTEFEAPAVEGEAETVVVHPTPAVTLSGTLRDAAGEPIPWVTMVLVGEHNVVTNAGPEGGFSLSATPGEYHLSVYGTGGPDLPHHWMVFSETFDLTADRSGDVVLPPTRTLTVQALGSGGTPLEGATVVFPTYDGAETPLGEFAGESESETDTAVTDAEGRASVHVFADSKPETGGYDGRALVEPAPGSGYGVTQFEAPAVGGEAETVVVSLAGSGGKEKDTEPPYLKELRFEPSEIDTSAGEVTVHIPALIREESGLEYGLVEFQSPSGKGFIESTRFEHPVDSENEDFYEATATFPEGSEPGEWLVWRVKLGDKAGNGIAIGPEELAERGLPYEVNVVGAESSRPLISSISPSSGPEAGGTEVVISGSGFEGAEVVRFGGSKTEFVVKSGGEIRAWSPPGEGNVGVTVERGGEVSTEANFFYEPAEEKEPPRLKELGFEPAEFDASGGEVPVHVVARVDDSTGFVNGNIVFRSPSGESFVKATGFERLAGTEDLYETIATFPQGSEPGDWLVSSIYFYDEAGGELSLEAEGLVERGLPYEVTVLPSKVEPPEVGKISPTSGPEAGGTRVVITGAGFKGAEAVRFGGTKAEFEVRSAEEIVAYSPPGKGNVGVVVETAGGISPEVNFAYVPSATVSLTSSPNPSVRGQKVTFTATVSPGEGGATPVGTVAFVEGTSTLGVANLSKGVAKLSTTTLGAGEHPIVAEYSGDSHYGEADSSMLTQVVSKASTEVTLTSSLNPSPFGATGTLKAHVAAVAPGAGTPAGTVTFREGETVLDTVQLSAGNASLSLKALAPGTHSITASYSGDANDKASEGGPFTQTVTKASTELALTSTLDPAPFGSSATLKATVKAVTPGGGTPAGTVTFREGETVLAIVPLSAGSAKYALKTTAPGEHEFTASYGGEEGYEGSSGSIAQTIVAASTELTLTSTKNPAPHGSTGTIKATVKAIAPGAGTPTGTVTFREGGTVLAIVPLSDSAAIYPLKSFPVGEHAITATYNGSADYGVSEGSIAQVITG